MGSPLLVTGRALLVRIAAALLVALSPVGCRPTTTVDSGNPLVVGVAYEPTSLNPTYLTGFVGAYVAALVFSGLTTYDARGNVVPLLARDVPTVQNGGISENGRTVTFHLRRGVLWQDGVPLTAHDVVFTYRAIVDPKNAAFEGSEFGKISSVNAPDDLTVIVRLKTPYAAIVPFFFGGDTNTVILPAHLLHEQGSLRTAPFNAAPIGSGPYRVVRWQRADRLLLEANDRYFLGAPAIKHLELRFVPDSQSMLRELQTGEVSATFFADVAQLAALERLANHRIVSTPSAAFGAIEFNTQDAILSDVRIRRAFALAIDRAQLARKVAHGSFDPNGWMRALFSWGSDPGVRLPPYAPALANRLLDAAGWQRAPDGIRRKGAQKLTIQLAFYGRADTTQRFVTSIAEEERAVGIDVALKHYDVVPFTAALRAGRFQSAFVTHFASGDPEVSYLLACAERAPGGFNVTRYCNAKVDAALQTGASTFDRTVRRKAYAIVQRRLVEDVPLAFLYRAAEIDVLPAALRGYVAAPYRSPFATAARWRFAQRS